MGTINSSDRVAATLYSLGTWFVLGIYVQIPCIKDTVMMMVVMIILGRMYKTYIITPNIYTLTDILL
jgi:hypothetical protein